ncbi:Bacteriorhodopsin-like protein family protein [Pleurostoma richardsiae]|uniref:Bacteriorhodopsin-like protein family protein n=1 Tax=Pleurostoma richardsiae TaxID=41990 RepID=A0AA38R8W2_9PEZI|nr:Bacteriorhodopsin-like protein family protein [Pleurostoma richardsiae]
MTLMLRGNDALNVNPLANADETLSLHGSDWLWAVTAIYIVAFIGLLSLCFTAPESKRVFHYLFTVALLVGAVTYYAQASDLGWSVVQQADQLGHGETRQMFYAKYINWVVSFPSIALALGLLSGVSWTTIFCNISIAWLWVLTYLAAAYTATDYKWGFFAFGTLSWLILAMSTMNESREEATRLGIGRDYIILAGWPNLLWLLYPIAFGLSDGGNRIGVTSSFIFFGVLDVLMIPVFSFVFVLMARRWDWGRLNLDFSEYRGSGHHRTLLDKEPQVATAAVTASD